MSDTKEKESTSSAPPRKPAAEETAEPHAEWRQKVRQLEESLRRREDELATAEAQRDELLARLGEAENRLAAERALTRAGVTDLETASLLLSRRVDLCESVTPEELAAAVERLLLDKPFLRAPLPPLPPATRVARDAIDPTARLAEAAQRAVETGNRRDVVEYLRLRRTMKSSR